MHTVSETVFINLLIPVHNVQPMEVKRPRVGSQFHYETKTKMSKLGFFSPY